ncbi:hypothetical protein GCM10020219_079430 [Nonomuraea dietziae]
MLDDACDDLGPVGSFEGESDEVCLPAAYFGPSVRGKRRKAVHRWMYGRFRWWDEAGRVSRGEA